MRVYYRFAFALIAAASVPLIFGNPVIAADFTADLREGGARIQFAVMVSPGNERHGRLAPMDRRWLPF